MLNNVDQVSAKTSSDEHFSQNICVSPFIWAQVCFQIAVAYSAWILWIVPRFALEIINQCSKQIINLSKRYWIICVMTINWLYAARLTASLPGP